MNQSRTLSVDQRLELLLERRYPGAQLDALGKSFFSKIGKSLKKVAKVALPAAAVYFGGSALLPLLKKGGGKAPRAPRAPKAARLRPIKVTAKKIAAGAGRVGVAVAQDAAAAAISAGAIPLQPGALRSNEELLSTAVQIARSQLANEGVSMNSPDAQDIVRQAVREAGQLPPAPGFDFQKALPWIAGGGLLLVAMTMGSRPPR